jgi:hypothetical protein
MRRGLPTLLVLLSLLSLSGCKPPQEASDPNRPVEVVLLTTPARVGPAAIEVRLLVDGAPALGASVNVRGDMTHAGMVPIIAPTVVEVGGGVYRTQGFAFDMSGDWVLTAEVRYPDGVTRSGSLAVSVSR